MRIIAKSAYAIKNRKSIILLSSYFALMILSAVVFNKYVDKESLQILVKSSGVYGIAVFFLIEVLYVTLTPLLNSAILIAAGYIFGGHLGFIINFLSTSIGLFLIVGLVKIYGRPLLHKLLTEKFNRRIDEVTQKVGPITLLIAYVLPFTPDDELTYILAAGPIQFKRFIAPILLGTLGKSAYSYIGDTGTNGIMIATYARILFLVIGLIIVGILEYKIKNKVLTEF